MDIEGGAFWRPELNEECHQMLKSGLKETIRVVEVGAHINSDAFADAVYDELVKIVTA